MPVNKPTNIELLEAVEEFLRETVAHEVQGSTKYNSRVAANVLAILRRELSADPAIDADAVDRLETLTGDTGSEDKLTQKLSAMIRDGSLDYKDPRLMEHLKKSAVAKLKIDNPRYPSLRRRMEP